MISTHNEYLMLYEKVKKWLCGSVLNIVGPGYSGQCWMKITTIIAYRVAELVNVYTIHCLEHNLFKCKWVIFWGETQIQTIKYSLNDIKRIKNAEFKLILYSFTTSDMNFQTFL